MVRLQVILRNKSHGLSASSPTRMWTSVNVPQTGEIPFTDYSRWRLVVNDGGRHTWTYLRNDEEARNWSQNELDKFWLGLNTVSPILHPVFDCASSMNRTKPRVYQICPNQRAHSTLLGTDTSSTRTCRHMMDIGLENMEGPCSSFQDSSLARM